MKRHLSLIASLGMCFFASNTTAHAQVRADTGGIAIGGSVTGSTISIGVPPEQLAALVRQHADFSETQKKLTAKLEGELDLNQRQIRAALSILGENDIPPERLAAKLGEIAERFKDLKATTSAQPGDNPTIVSLKADADKAIAGGDLAKADALLAAVETEQKTEQRSALDRLAVNAAETSARRGNIALTRLQYGEAAKHFANAAAVFPPGSAHEDERIGYLHEEESALYQQGDEQGDNDALRSAIERNKRLLELTPRERVPLKWARTLNNLGIVLGRLGERESGTAKLEEAVVAYREALKEWTRERVPLAWAKTQNNLASALAMLGDYEGGTAKFEEAVAAYREALKESTRERVPLEWAMIQNNLGVTLSSLGQLEEAAGAYREALKEWTRERVPLYWAQAQNGLGDALSRLGERESETAKLEEAVAAYREALKERIRERVPVAWALSSGNQGVSLMLLAARRRDVAMAKTALSQINTAFETMRDGGHASIAAHYERKLPWARAIVARLGMGGL